MKIKSCLDRSLQLNLNSYMSLELVIFQITTLAFFILTHKFIRYIYAQVLIPYCVCHTFAYKLTLNFE